MSLLRDIQEGTTDQAIPLSDLLRKCRILAKRLQHGPLASWAEQELDGYPDKDTLPPYRQHRAEARGNFVGPMSAQRRNVLIPRLAVKEEYRDSLFTAHYDEAVAHYEGLLKSDEQDYGKYWPADFVALYGQDFMKGYVCTSVWLCVTRGTLEGMLDQIRSRILSFVLDIEEENPGAGEASTSGDPPVSRDKIDQVFNTTILGGTNVVASGSDNIIGYFTQVAGDWSSLKDTLERLGVPGPDIDALESAIEEDGDEPPPGGAVKSWVQNIKDRLASGTLTLTGSATGSAIATLVLQYLGFI